MGGLSYPSSLPTLVWFMHCQANSRPDLLNLAQDRGPP